MAGSGSLTAGLLSPQLFASMLAADGAAVLAAHLDAMDIAGASGDAVATWASTIGREERAAVRAGQRRLFCHGHDDRH
jgi:hypothetical protein